MTCECEAELTPTSDGKVKISYTIYTFGCNSDGFPSSKRLHESLLDKVAGILDATTNMRIAIRVGSDAHFAIYIRDLSGGIRSCEQSAMHAVRPITDIAQFLQIGHQILNSHTNTTAGNVFLNYISIRANPT